MSSLFLNLQTVRKPDGLNEHSSTWGRLIEIRSIEKDEPEHVLKFIELHEALVMKSRCHLYAEKFSIKVIHQKESS